MDPVLSIVTDNRATQYWDTHAAVAGPYDELFDLAGPCAGVFALYDRGAMWHVAKPPSPVRWQDAHADQRGREANPEFDADAMAEEIQRRLQNAAAQRQA